MTASNTSGAEFSVPTDVVNPTITGIDSFTPYTSLGDSMTGGSITGGSKLRKKTLKKQRLTKRAMRKQSMRKKSMKSKKQRKKKTQLVKRQMIREKAINSIASGIELSKQELRKLSPNMQKFLQQLPKTKRMRTMATALTVDLPTLGAPSKKPSKQSTQRILKQLEKYNLNVRKHGKRVNRNYSPAELQFLDGVMRGKVDFSQFQIEKIPKTVKTNKKSKSKLLR